MAVVVSWFVFFFFSLSYNLNIWITIIGGRKFKVLPVNSSEKKNVKTSVDELKLNRKWVTQLVTTEHHT